MEKIDLNLDNYDLEDLLGLFALEPTYSEGDLRSARKVVMRMHPDKSGLEKEYFIFFSKAFNVLVNVLRFRERSEVAHVADRASHSLELTKSQVALLDKVNKSKGFHRWFNEMFVASNETLYERGGHGDWLKSDEDIDTRQTTKNGMAEAFEKKKRETRALVRHEGIEQLDSHCGAGTSELGNETKMYSSGDVFSKLQFEDLRKAHTETVVPVTKMDAGDRASYTFSRMQNERATQDITPMAETKAMEYLNRSERDQTSLSTRRAFDLAKQDERARKQSESWWSKLRLLEGTGS
jgi:hypothetical protein